MQPGRCVERQRLMPSEIRMYEFQFPHIYLYNVKINRRKFKNDHLIDPDALSCILQLSIGIITPENRSKLSFLSIVETFGYITVHFHQLQRFLFSIAQITLHFNIPIDYNVELNNYPLWQA